MLKETENSDGASVQQAINEARRDVRYLLSDFPVETLVKRLKESEAEEGDIYVPGYQRTLQWDNGKKSYFIESLILRIPLPPLFFYEIKGLLEIVDGSQRIRSLAEFVNGRFSLEGLEKLDVLNGLKFSDLPDETRRRFLNTPIRSYLLEEGTDQSTCIELFRRINTSPKQLTEAEIRIGAYRGVFLDLVLACSNSSPFKELAPGTGTRGNKNPESERQELATRFFVYLLEYKNFRHDVRRFIDQHFVRLNRELSNEEINSMQNEFQRVMLFISEHMPRAFYRGDRGTQVPRVRFEAVAVGTALALREQPDLGAPVAAAFLDSDEFAAIMRTDASNSGPKLRGRIEFVRDRLLGR